MDKPSLTDHIRRKSADLGFNRVGVCPAISATGFDDFIRWLARGNAGQMAYMVDRKEAYEHPRNVLSGVRSLIILTRNYQTQPSQETGPTQGRISRYAWGPKDYHDLIRRDLHSLADHLRELAPDCQTRCVVDTAPLLERDYARLAGLGWVGKNTMLIHKRDGSLFFLAALLTDVELEYDEPFTADHCGTCTACLDACPTDAFPEPYVLDARRCISYTTIELRSMPEESMRIGQGDWLFGCDICQDVCPWNHRAPVTNEPAFEPQDEHNPIDLCTLFYLDDGAFRERFRKTPLWRPRRAGILRNAAFVLGNKRSVEAFAALAHGLKDKEPLVRAACAWALGNLSDPKAFAILRESQAVEQDEMVIAELSAALERFAAR